MTQIRQAHITEITWHALDTAEVCTRLRPHLQGLGNNEAAARLV